ncbi:DUF2511 domain-containing protein [Mycobacterium sp.]|uniref:DUF2511 domain-containing protein n=1 Tax=Mycobacterium sp. TaxID=1785 RepID=UPI001274D783|nr:DUF2511 domain-containing protein [Mycobacterium sp.]KAA8970488.1 MAG: hypothetical protein F6Q13_00590 [Mycobacterium sp.]
MGIVRTVSVALVVVLGALGSAGCRPEKDKQSVHTKTVSKSTFKGVWPLIPESGVLACDAGAVTFRPTDSNDIYAVNAIAGSRADRQGWRGSLEHIWLTAGGGHSDRSGVSRVPLTDLIDAGLKLCGPPWSS